MRTIDMVHMVDNLLVSSLRPCNVIKAMDLMITLKAPIASHLPTVSDLLPVLRGKSNQTQMLKPNILNLFLTSHAPHPHMVTTHLSAMSHP